MTSNLTLDIGIPVKDGTSPESESRVYKFAIAYAAMSLDQETEPTECERCGRETICLHIESEFGFGDAVCAACAIHEARCFVCDGDGHIEADDGEPVCPRCDGDGLLTRNIIDPEIMDWVETATAPICGIMHDVERPVPRKGSLYAMHNHGRMLAAEARVVADIDSWRMARRNNVNDAIQQIRDDAADVRASNAYGAWRESR